MRSFGLLFTILLGIVFYQGAEYTFLIRYLLMALLFLTFLNARFDRKSLNVFHLKILVANLLLGPVFFFIFRPFSLQLALAALLIGLMPTAAVAPILTEYLKGKVELVTTSVVLNVLAIGAATPFLLPLFVEVEQPITVLSVLGPVFVVIFIPLILAQIVQRIPLLYHGFNKIRSISFFVFMANLYLATAKASYFIRFEQQAGWEMIAAIAGVSFVMCLAQFSLGHFLGKPEYVLEGKLALGRRNTIFGLWLALSFVNPLVALGPLSYILWHNLYIAYLLSKNKKT